MSKIEELYNKLTDEQKEIAERFIDNLIPVEIDFNNLCDHSSWQDYQIVNNVFNSFEFNRNYNTTIAESYDSMPAYKIMFGLVESIVDAPDRHKIIMSPDTTSCLRYISFNISNEKWIGNMSKLYVNFHFRSQNSVMLDYDKQYANAVVENFLVNSSLNIEDADVMVTFIVDEYISRIK